MPIGRRVIGISDERFGNLDDIVFMSSSSTTTDLMNDPDLEPFEEMSKT